MLFGGPKRERLPPARRLPRRLRPPCSARFDTPAQCVAALESDGWAIWARRVVVVRCRAVRRSFGFPVSPRVCFLGVFVTTARSVLSRRTPGAPRRRAVGETTQTRPSDHFYRPTHLIELGWLLCHQWFIIRDQLAQVTDLELMRIVNND